MKKLTILLLITIFNGVAFAQNSINVTVSGNIFNADFDSVKISHFFGKYYKDYLSVPIDKKGNFTIKGNLPAMDYYVLRIGKSQAHLILRDKSDIKIYGDGKKISKFCNIVGSDESHAMNQFSNRMDRWNIKSDSAMTALKADTSKAKAINDYMSKEFLQYQNDRQEFIASNQNSPALIISLVSMNIETEFEAYESIMNQVTASFGESPTVKEYAKYVQSIKDKKLAEAKQLNDAALLSPGKVSPDFEELGIDRKTKISLASLKGKVVLIDFWASWCGPCRKENPNVVRIYEKYKDKGFTIMSVSLDTDKDKWIAAINQDKLTWPNHVSDLGGWNSRVGKMYQVNSVPFTVLIDKEGNIIKTNLRGEELENQLESIFSEAEVQNMPRDASVPPNFEELGTDRKTTISLASLKGKVVLIDFWASWCGPCRKENPNVVRLYEKYKDQGFTVMSVSLDTEKDKWIAAIKKDKLTWPNHVSDLGGWESRVGKLYYVNSIPYTVLVDKEGKIINKNIRGEELENELKKIFNR
jgi:thiol-disulfide isomerase/thioredoxin